MLNGIDISNWQGDVNFGSVDKTQDFVIIKATEGYGYKDPRFEEYRSELRRLGIVRGYYHFARPDLNNSPENEADWFLSIVSPLQEGESLHLDFEVNVPNPVEWCKRFLDRISEALEGYKPLIYLNKFTVQNFDWSPVAKAGYGLWLALWDQDPDGSFTVSHWDLVAMRQYTSDGSVNGISGRVDMNVFYGDEEQLLAYGIQTGEIPCEKIKLENEQLKSDKNVLLEQNKGLSDSLKDLNTIYKKLLEEDKIEDEEMKQLLRDYDAVTVLYKDLMANHVKLDQINQGLNEENVSLSRENTRLKLQKFTVRESLAFLIRAIRGGGKA